MVVIVSTLTAWDCYFHICIQWFSQGLLTKTWCLRFHAFFINNISGGTPGFIMNEMKEKLTNLFFVFAMLVSVSSCHKESFYRLDDHDGRLAALETVCKQMNTNISSLQGVVTALEQNDYVKSVTPVVEDGKTIGYTITFTKSKPVTIYHGEDGEDGKDGKDGKDGETPIVSLKQDTDNNWYWTLNGEWLLDEAGNKVRANGVDGKDGVTPQLKIVDDYWYISNDKGENWKQLGKATGEKGKDGKDGKDGDSMFAKVDCTTSTDYVKLTLADGTVISIPTTSAMETLQNTVNQLNTNLSSIETIVKALKENDYVKSVTPLSEGGKVVGYTITFSKSGAIVIYHGKDGTNGSNGTNGTNGVNGKDGITPEFKIDDGYWFISYDKGGTWTKLGKATGEGGSVISDVKEGDNSVTLTLADGKTIELPKKPAISLTIENADEITAALPGSEIYLKYRVANATDATVVTAASDGNYAVRVNKGDKSSGTIVVTCPMRYVDGCVNVIVSEGDIPSGVTVVKFYKGEITFSKGTEFSVSTEGGEVTVPFVINYDYRVIVDRAASAWLTLTNVTYGTTTGAEPHSESMTISVAKNADYSSRQGKVFVYAKANEVTPVATITINQASAYFELSKSSVALSYEGGREVLTAKSSNGLKLVVPSDASSWLSAIYSEGTSSGQYDVTVSASRNDGSTTRRAVIACYSSDGTKHLGDITVAQGSTGSYDLADMVFVVRANITNDFTAYLPLADDIDCYVDWGDGNVEYVKKSQYESLKVSHKYASNEVKNYTVIISGEVTSLSSYDFSAHSVTEVVQWGQTGLTEMRYAFSGNTMLTSVCADDMGAFSNVHNFQNAFYECIKLTSLPSDLFANCGKVTSFAGCFYNCIGLVSLPSGLFANCTNVISFGELVVGTFAGCTGLTSLPPGLFANCGKVTSFAGCFYKCIGLVSLPSALFADCGNVTSFDECFGGCTGLTSLPPDLFANCGNVTDFGSCFEGCTGLTSIPSSIFDNCRKVTDFSRTFFSCSNLTGESPYTIINGLKVHLYERNNYPDDFMSVSSSTNCFLYCNKLSDSSSIPSTWKSF